MMLMAAPSLLTSVMSCCASGQPPAALIRMSVSIR
jgi:hypothetical protein